MRSESPPGLAGAASGPAPLIERDRPVIVLAYPDGRLDNPWFRAYKRVKRGMRTKGIGATVELRPGSDLPADAVLVIVPEALAGSAALPAGHVVTTADRLQAEVDRLVERLLADGRLQLAPPASRAVAVHRGFLPVTSRARVRE